MTEIEVKKLFLIINNTYHGFVFDEHKVKIWSDLLRNVDFQLAQKNLRSHIMTEKFPPTIADIAKKPEPKGPIPNAEETRLMLEQREREWKQKAVPMPEYVKERLKLIGRK